VSLPCFSSDVAEPFRNHLGPLPGRGVVREDAGHRCEVADVPVEDAENGGNGGLPLGCVILLSTEELDDSGDHSRWST
jgi:hypothetical protein